MDGGHDAVGGSTQELVSSAEGSPSSTPSPPHSVTYSKWRNILSFWLLGFLNNYPYVVMLSAAFDIIHSVEQGSASENHNSSNVSSCTLVINETTNSSSYPPRDLCQQQGTSVCVHSVCLCEHALIMVVLSNCACVG